MNEHIWLKSIEESDVDLNVITKEEKTNYVSLDFLRETRKMTDRNDRPVNGIHHFDLIDWTNEMLDKENHTFTLKPIAVIANKNRTMGDGVSIVKDKDFDPNDIQPKDYFLRKLLWLHLISFGSNDYKYGIVTSYDQQGIQTALGPNVNACVNMAIINRSSFWSTFGSGHVPLDKMKEYVSLKIKDMGGSFRKETNILDEMKKIIIPEYEVHEMIGDMMCQRARYNSKLFDGDKDFIPLNKTQIGQFADKYQNWRLQNEDNSTVYELYNMATDFHKPGIGWTEDTATIIPANLALGTYLLDRSGILLN